MAMEFLSGFGNAMQNLQGSMHAGFGNKISEALFGREDRISNRDYQFYQDLADSGNRRDIGRQNAFLEGVTPTNAAQYNAYQQATYGEDTSRQSQRIQGLASNLKMSPWEITGSGGSSPLPSPTMGETRGNDSPGAAFMSQITPLLTAKMAQETALKTTAMNNETAKEINTQNTAGGELPKANVEKVKQDVAASLQGMDESKSRMAVQAADVTLRTQHRVESIARTSQIGAQTKYLAGVQTDQTRQQTSNLQLDYDMNALRMELMRNQDLRDSIITLQRVAPSETWHLPGHTRTETASGADLVALAHALTATSGSRALGSVAGSIENMPDKQLNDGFKAAAALGGIVKSLGDLGGKAASTRLTHAKTVSPSEY